MKTLNVHQHLCLSMLLRLTKIGVHGLLTALQVLPKSSPENLAAGKLQLPLMEIKQSLEDRLYARYSDDYPGKVGIVYRDMLSMEELAKIEKLELEVKNAQPE